MWDNECPCCKGFGLYSIPDATGRGVQIDCDRCDGIGFLASEEELAKGQSRKGSLVETCASTAIGFAVSLVLTAIVMPAFGYPTTWAHDFWITVIFTVASVVRGYCVRRFFEALR